MKLSETQRDFHKTLHKYLDQLLSRKIVFFFLGTQVCLFKNLKFLYFRHRSPWKIPLELLLTAATSLDNFLQIVVVHITTLTTRSHEYNIRNNDELNYPRTILTSIIFDENKVENTKRF